MENMSLYEKVRSVPNEALKEIKGGRLKGMSDINPMWRIKMLTELFGVCGVGWKIEITDRRLEKGGADETVCFVDINLYIKTDGEWSEPIPGMGGSSFITKEKNGLYTSDECFKMAYTDAISVACKSLGFAADVYFASDRTKYTKDDKLKNVDDITDEDLNAIQQASDELMKEWSVTLTPVIKGRYQAIFGSIDGIEEYAKKFASEKALNAELARLLQEKTKKGA